MILKRIFSSSWMLVIKDAKPLVLASRDTFIASTSRSSALLTLFNATQFRVPKGDVMPAEIRAQVDVAKKIPGGTLKFTTRKKRLEDSTGGISSYRCCLKLRSCLAILVIRVEKNVGEVYAMIWAFWSLAYNSGAYCLWPGVCILHALKLEELRGRVAMSSNLKKC